MVWRIASRFVELGGKQPAISQSALYALFDGLFQKCLLRHLSNDSKAISVWLGTTLPLANAKV